MDHTNRWAAGSRSGKQVSRKDAAGWEGEGCGREKTEELMPMCWRLGHEAKLLRPPRVKHRYLEYYAAIEK